MHEIFHYNSLAELTDCCRTQGVSLPLSENTDILRSPCTLGGRKLPNRLAIQPMEGCDGTAEGAPDELTFRRYARFAESGAAVVWFEATAVVPEGRANPRQLMLTRQNLDVFRRLTADIREQGVKKCGFAPLLILQATHSGRYSKPNGVPASMVLSHHALLEQDKPLPDEAIVSDEYLDRLPERYAETAKLAVLAGFDGVDVKSCHRYLLSESLSAFLRPGRYGGSFDNRTRLLLRAVDAVSAEIGGTGIVASRLNLYDGYPYPYGFGVSEAGGVSPDLAEPIRLVQKLIAHGVALLDFSIGNPYHNPHVNRPFDRGPYTPEEHPLAGVARMCDCIATVKRAVPGVPVICSGLSYLRQFSPALAAGMLESGGADLAGFGRMAFAYPDFAAEILAGRALDPGRCCIACSKCSQLMRAGTVAGCVVRDAEVYAPIYRKAVLENPKDIIHAVSGM